MLLQGLQVPNPSIASADLLLPAQLLPCAHTPPRSDHGVPILDEPEPLPLPLPRSEMPTCDDSKSLVT